MNVKNFTIIIITFLFTRCSEPDERFSVDIEDNLELLNQYNIEPKFQDSTLENKSVHLIALTKNDEPLLLLISPKEDTSFFISCSDVTFDSLDILLIPTEKPFESCYDIQNKICDYRLNNFELAAQYSQYINKEKADNVLHFGKWSVDIYSGQNKDHNKLVMFLYNCDGIKRNTFPVYFFISK